MTFPFKPTFNRLNILNFTRMKRISNTIIFFGIGLALTLSSCGSDPLDVDVSETNLALDYLNMDSLLYNSKDRVAALDNLPKEYQKVIEYQTYFCYQVGLNPQIPIEQDIQDFYSNLYVQRLEKSIHKKFPNPIRNHAKIIDGFKHLKYHLPKAKMPKGIVYANSYFSSSAFCTEDRICMGMERYLGKNDPVIKELPADRFYEYIKEAMDPAFFERDAVCAWVYTHIIEVKDDEYTIESIVNWGKILYLTEAAYPELGDEIIVRYSKKDLEWALKNERQFWDFMIKQKMLYSKDEKVKQNLLHEAPFTSGLPDAQNSPDRLGQFLGWRIIHSYMEQYDVTLQELINTPYTKLIQEYEIND